VAEVDLGHLTDQMPVSLVDLAAVDHVSAQVVELANLEVTVEEQQQDKEILAALVNQPHTHMVAVVVVPVDQEMIDISQHQSDQLTMHQMQAAAMAGMAFNMILLVPVLGMPVVAELVVLTIILITVKVD
jgi:uncharacterized membrane protein